VVRANQRQKRVLAARVIERLGEGGRLDGRKVAVWGLAFKPETDDIRESPALVTVRALVAAGAQVVGFDPAAMPNVRAELGDLITYAVGPYEAVDGADALVLITEWHEFRRPDFQLLRARMRGDSLFDGRNVWAQDETRRAGFHCYAIGRPPTPSSS